MGHRRFFRAAQHLVTVSLLVTVVATTFLPDWVQRSQAAAPAVDSGSAGASTADAGSAAAAPARVAAPELAPLNALILSEPGRAESLKATILDRGGYVYVSQGDALFVGAIDLTLSELAPLGARAIYRERVPAADLAALSPRDRDAVAVWNEMIGAGPVGANISVTDASTDSHLVVVRDESPVPRDSGNLYEPTDKQTSVFMIGSVAVEVVFVESETLRPDGTTISKLSENWTADEISKVKAEVVSALDWWTVAARAPKAPDELSGEDPLPRPPAHLTWQVTYHTPLEGTTAQRNRVKVNREPSSLGTTDAELSWMGDIANNFGYAGTSVNTKLRTWAHQARQPSATSPGADWGFVLFVVDTSNNSNGKNGRFNDGKIAAAALNGPWAVVTYDAGDLGVNNLEVIIAKMVGHLFGAGDEANCHSTPGEEEYYGYLRVAHENCAYGFSPLPSLMLDGSDMIEAYKEHRLSLSARGQIGWLDRDENGVYDVIDTLQDTLQAPGSPAVCPVLHLSEVDVLNEPALPSEFGPGPEGEANENGWWGYVWNPQTNMMDFGVEYHKVNINRVGFVWGRINGGEWTEATPADGNWNGSDEGYNLLLPGNPGAINTVEIAIMNRWGQEAYTSPSPVNISVQAAKTARPEPYESNLDSNVTLYDRYGLVSSWTEFSQAGYSGGSTKVAVNTGDEACFSISGTEVSILYNNEASSYMDVYVDGKLHSTIKYTGTRQALRHKISNLPDGDHTIQLFAGGYDVDFDAFIVSDMRADTLSVIDALDEADIPADSNGFYEDTGVKIKYVGQWSTQSAYTLNDTRPGTPDDWAHTSTYANDRIYIRFKRADTMAIYREVFPGGGSADVYVDDGTGSKYWGTMYNDATVPMVAPYYISGLVSSDVITYTVEVRINPGAPRFTFDALRLLNLEGTPELYAVTGDDPLEVPFNGAQETNGAWQARDGFIRGANTGDLLTVFFKGMAIAVNRDTASGYGVMELYVDGKLLRTVDNKDAGAKDAPVVLHGFDRYRPHALQVRVVREKPGVARWNHVRGYTVFNVPVVEPGAYEEYEYNGNVPTYSRFLYEQDWASPVLYTGTPGPSGQHYIFSKHRDAKVFLYFSGADTVTIYGASAAKFGAADVYVNGELRGTFVQKGKLGFDQPFTITGLDKLAVNVLELRVANQAGMKKSISLDRVVLYNRPVLSPGTYQNDELVGGVLPALQFSGQWNRVENAAASGTYDVVGSAYDQVVFDVRDASSVVVYRRLFRQYGRADVYVDGVYHSSFDNATNTALNGVFQQPYVIGGLDRGFSHRIVIKPQVNKRGRYKPFDIDYIQVRNLDAEGVTYLEEGYYDQNDPGALAGGAISYQGSNWTVNSPTPNNPNTRLESVSEARGSGRGDRAVVVFRGNSFSVFFNRFSKAGKVDIYIDGALVGTVNNQSTTPIYDVPFAVAGLAEKTHTAEIIIRGGQVGIDAYMARTMIPDNVINLPDLKTELGRDPMQRPILVSGLWKVEGDYITTREKDAAIYAYGIDDDTLIMTRQAKRLHGNIDIYIDNELRTTAETGYLGSWPTPDEDFEISGLAGMKDKGAWIAVKNAQAKVIMLKQLQITGLTPVLPSDCNLEAEDLGASLHLHAAGPWKRMPARANNQHRGGYYLQSVTRNSSIYIPIQYVNYLTIFRPVSNGLGDAEVYIDGEFWGIMPGQGGREQAQAPFSIGPIDVPTDPHVIELRPAHKTKKIALDWVKCEGLRTLSPDDEDYFGYYENDSEPLTGLDANGEPVGMSAYSGVWSKVAEVNASGNSVHRTARKGDRLAFLFTGNSITLYRGTSGYGRFATAYIDGVAYPINNKSATVRHRVPHTILLPGDPQQTHTFELVVNSGRFDLDAIQIDYAEPGVFGYYQEDHPQVIVNDANHWQTIESEAHSQGAYIKTNTKYASLFFLFNGQRVTTYMMQGRYWGRVSVFLDGQFKEEVDLRKFDPKNPGAPDEPFFVYDITHLPLAYHVLELRFEGNRTRGGKPQINFDVVSVNGAPVPRPGQDIFPPTPPDIGGGDPGGEIKAPRVGCFEEAHPEWDLVGDWIPYGFTGASYDTLAVPNAQPGMEAYAEFDFAATGFGLMVAKGPNGGYADIYVNGAPYILDYSMYNETQIALDPANTLITGTGYDPNVRNVVKIVWKETPGTGGGTQIYIDRIDLPAYDSKYNNNCIYTED